MFAHFVRLFYFYIYFVCVTGKVTNQGNQLDLLHVLLNYNLPYEDTLKKLGGKFGEFAEDVQLQERLRIECLYRSMIKRMAEDMETVRKEANLIIPEDLDFSKGNSSKNLSQECIEKLSLHRPQTIGSASRIAGITPTDLLHILFAIKANDKKLKKCQV